MEEHLSLKRVLSDLLELSPDDERFEPKLHVLKEQVEHHHKEEEEKLFPKARKLFDEARLAALGGEMQKAMGEIERRGQPRRLVLSQTEEAAPLG
jgi:hemerythrin superfamily protein